MITKIIETVSDLFAQGLIPFFMATNGHEDKKKINIIRLFELVFMVVVLIGFMWQGLSEVKMELKHINTKVQEVKTAVHNHEARMDEHVEGHPLKRRYEYN